MSRSELKPEARVILRVSDDDDERTAAFTEDVQAAPHKLRTNALPLAIWEHGHRRQSHTNEAAPRTFEDHRRKEDMTHNRVILRNQ